MAPSKLGLGMIGANVGYGWGMRAHLPALAALPDYDLVAVCTAHRETAEAAAQRYGARKAYWDYQALVHDPEVQVVDVCVRVPLHYEMVLAALRAGKHVYCEWPLGANTAQAEELAALARQQGVRTMVGLQARAAPSVLRLRELIAEGYVGQVLAATMTQFLPGILRPRPGRAAWSAAREAGAHVLSIAAGHALDLLCYAVGEFGDLSASVNTQVAHWPLSDADQPAPVTSPDNVLIAGRLTSGAVASVHIASIPWHGSAFRMEVYGTEGTLVATSDQMAQFVDLRLRGGRCDESALDDLAVPERLRWVPGEVPAGVPLNVAQMLARLAQGIRTGEEVSPDFTEAARRHRLLDAIQRAADTRGWVSLASGA
ncbi:MAG: Gfo/Idh/MocA family oxidoreductase [Chloroflexi bacterium]|nr:Gfo/Idh/MocA family oxidoreductase [Chloroflexota bacterium]